MPGQVGDGCFWIFDWEEGENIEHRTSKWEGFEPQSREGLRSWDDGGGLDEAKRGVEECVDEDAEKWVDGISGHSRGDHPTDEAAVDFEVGVGGVKKWIGQDLRKPDQTGVGNAHGDIGVFF